MGEQRSKNFSFLQKAAVSPRAIFVFLVFCSLFFVLPVLAQAPPLNLGLEYAEYTGLANTDIRMIIAKIIRAALGLLGLVALGFTIYGGYMYMTAGGNEEKIATAKKILKNMVIGLAIILSALGIVQFIINAIYNEYEDRYGQPEWPAGYNEEFVIGGFLGSVIESHYPGRNAIDIARNTKIVITFKQKINPSTLILDSNDNGVFGDTSGGDQINSDNIKIYATAEGTAKALGMNPTDPADDASAYLSADGRTVVFQPKNYLGNSLSDTNYTVRLTNGVKLIDGSDAFKGMGGYYSWQFTVSTKDDKDPPKVESVIPLPATTPYPRNIIVQMNFNEAVDPISASGIFKAGDSSKNFQNITIASSTQLVSGAFKITNQYRTVEFISDSQCGVNPCGQPIFCLPENKTLTVTAKTPTLSNNPPQALITANLYDGVVDMAGNVLNGGGELKRDSQGNLILAPGVKKPEEWQGQTGEGGAAAGETVSSGLLAYWTFDTADVDSASVYDKSGQGNNGTKTGGVRLVGGAIGQAGEFDGSTGYVNAGTSSSLQPTEAMTISFWMKANVTNGIYDMILGNTNGNALTVGYSVYLHTNNLVFHINHYGVGANRAVKTFSDTTSWHQVVVQYAKAGPKIWVDKVAGTFGTATDNIGYAGALGFGMGATGFWISEYLFNGSLDDVRVYNRALSVEEINELYDLHTDVSGGFAFDDFFWKFNTSADIDTIAPKISAINPDSQAQDVSPSAPLSISFNKPMSIGAFREIILKTNKDFNVWYTPRGLSYDAAGEVVTTTSQTPVRTTAELLHGDFWQKPVGSAEPEAIYYPFVPSSVTDIYQNCFYPAEHIGTSCVTSTGALNDSQPSCFDNTPSSYKGFCGVGETCPFSPGPKP